MRLYQAKVLNTCPRRVTVYMAEKGIECDVVTLDMRGGAGRTPEFQARSPGSTVPVLELDDGTFLPESLAIIEYLEERYPDPPMLGETPQERAQVRATERMANEFQLRNALHSLNSHPSWGERRPEWANPVRQVAEYLAPARDRLLQALEQRIGANEYLAGSRPTIADCSLFGGVDTLNRIAEYEFPASAPNLRGWYERFRQRPSAQYPDWAVERAAVTANT